MEKTLARQVIIIGGGASGTLLACQLLKDAPRDLRVTMVERRDDAGRGVAYSTRNPAHLLNVRAALMSAFPDDQDHFVRWLAASGHAGRLQCADGSCFAPRMIYGDYLQDLLSSICAGEGHQPLTVVHGDCIAITRDAGRLTAVMADGAVHCGDVVVLATGNEFHNVDAAQTTSPADRLTSSLDDTVLMIGTGLTMIDHVLTLAGQGHRGPIIAISRRGLLPRPHRQVTAITMDRAEIPFGASASQMTTWLRHRIRRADDWRPVFDALRPFMSEMWQSLRMEEKTRFLRHATAWWDVHRHRMAPQIALQIETLIADGRLTVIAAKIAGIDEQDGSKTVRFRRRGSTAVEILSVDTILDCRGLNNSLSETRNHVLRDLSDKGMATSDPLRLGIAVTDDGALIDASGAASNDLFAIGPLTRGAFWEIVAIPDIRLRCQRLAAHIRTQLGV